MSYDTVNEDIVAAIDKLREQDRDALHLCNEEGIVTAADVAFQLAYPNARTRHDCLMAAGCLVRLEKLGAIERDRARIDTTRVVRARSSKPPVVYTIRSAWADALVAWTGRQTYKPEPTPPAPRRPAPHVLGRRSRSRNELPRT